LFSELGHKAANTFKIAENRRAAGSSFPIWENTNASLKAASIGSNAAALASRNGGNRAHYPSRGR
jgi:hypothetical protein